jgi:hypothetical protein
MFCGAFAAFAVLQCAADDLAAAKSSAAQAQQGCVASQRAVYSTQDVVAGTLKTATAKVFAWFCLNAFEASSCTLTSTAALPSVNSLQWRLSWLSRYRCIWASWLLACWQAF